MKLVVLAGAVSLVAASFVVPASAAKHTERYGYGDTDKTYAPSDSRRNSWREERREKSAGWWENDEERYGSAKERKKYWRENYRDSHSK